MQDSSSPLRSLTFSLPAPRRGPHGADRAAPAAAAPALSRPAAALTAAAAMETRSLPARPPRLGELRETRHGVSFAPCGAVVGG